MYSQDQDTSATAMPLEAREAPAAQRGPTIDEYCGLALLFLLGMWLVVLAPAEWGRLLPGGFDNRLNMYLLEHVFRWLGGSDPSLWTAPYFAGFPYSFAFSSNHLGTFPVYLVPRLLGMGRESAFIAWFAVGFALNFLVSARVLSRWKLSPLAAGIGAFIFTFNLPIQEQTDHAQMLYRFCTPAACYFLWKFARNARLWPLWCTAACFVWQFWCEIYNGIFLSFLLVALAIAFAWQERARGGAIRFWPRQIAAAWREAGPRARAWFAVGAVALAAALILVAWPYAYVVRLYHFRRFWPEIESMIPRLQSYALCDWCSLWGPLSAKIGRVALQPERRIEHSMFLGLGALALAAVGACWRRTPHRRLALASLTAFVLLFLFTIHLGPQSRYTIYRLLVRLPGFNAIRAVSRIILPMVWPASVLAAIGFEALWKSGRAWLRPIAYVLVAFAVFESATVNKPYMSRSVNAERIAKLRAGLPATLPSTLPASTVLAVHSEFYDVEIDAMLLAQDLGVATTSGYSGNFPPGWDVLRKCAQVPDPIAHALAFQHRLNEETFRNEMRRVVPVGFTDCDAGVLNTAPKVR